MTNTDIKAIPFLDLVTPHLELREDLSRVFARVLDTAGFVGGPMLQDFEEEFAAFCGTKHCAGVGSGTDALRFALIAAGVGQADVVVTVPNTFIATTEAISQAGARPVFVDVLENTFNIDPDKLRHYLDSECDFDPKNRILVDRKTNNRVKAVVPVHLYGQMADMDPIIELAEQYNLLVIEDACQAHGAQYFSRTARSWKKAGSVGHAAAFSFYPGKNLGACGEGGAVTTNDADIAKKTRMLRDHGQSQKYYHEIEGFNGRLDAIQAGFLQVKLRRLADWNEGRREVASHYRDLFAEAGRDDLPPFEPDWARSVYHLYVVRVRDRAGIIQHLTQANVGTGIHYPVPLHLQNAYKSLGYKKGDFPISEAVSSEILSLPMFPGLRLDQQERVVSEVVKFLAEVEKRGVSEKDLVATR